MASSDLVGEAQLETINFCFYSVRYLVKEALRDGLQIETQILTIDHGPKCPKRSILALGEIKDYFPKT